MSLRPLTRNTGLTVSGRRSAKDWSYEPDEGIIFTEEQCGKVDQSPEPSRCGAPVQLGLTLLYVLCFTRL